MSIARCLVYGWSFLLIALAISAPRARADGTALDSCGGLLGFDPQWLGMTETLRRQLAAIPATYFDLATRQLGEATLGCRQASVCVSKSSSELAPTLMRYINLPALDQRDAQRRLELLTRVKANDYLDREIDGIYSSNLLRARLFNQATIGRGIAVIAWADSEMQSAIASAFPQLDRMSGLVRLALADPQHPLSGTIIPQLTAARYSPLDDPFPYVPFSNPRVQDARGIERFNFDSRDFYIYGLPKATLTQQAQAVANIMQRFAAETFQRNPQEPEVHFHFDMELSRWGVEEAKNGTMVDDIRGQCGTSALCARELLEERLRLVGKAGAELNAQESSPWRLNKKPEVRYPNGRSRKTVFHYDFKDDGGHVITVEFETQKRWL